jgi:hypothetical protein
MNTIAMNKNINKIILMNMMPKTSLYSYIFFETIHKGSLLNRKTNVSLRVNTKIKVFVEPNLKINIEK